jgi:AcrR family transcriptional regulator
MAKKARSRPQQRRSQEMRQRLLDTAAQLLSQGGAVTTKEIADASHVSIGTVYRYFSDREEILGLLLEEAIQAIYNDVTAAVGAALDLRLDDATLLVVESLTASFERNAAILVAVGERGTDPVLARNVEATLFALARVIPARHRPDLTPAELDDLVFVAMGFTSAGCLRIALQRPPSGDREAMIGYTATMLAAALRPPS